METIALSKLWIYVATFGLVLGSVTAVSIPGVPSASHAIIAIRVAHLDLFWAKLVFRDSAVQEAELAFNQAWLNLQDQRYEQSILATRDTVRRVRGIKNGLPSLYSRCSGKASQCGMLAEIVTRAPGEGKGKQAS